MPTLLRNLTLNKAINKPSILALFEEKCYSDSKILQILVARLKKQLKNIGSYINVINY
jgi:hypothetical protein